MTRTLLVLALAGAAAATAQAEWRDMNGQKVEALVAGEWFNVGDNAPTPADLRGKVWILEFFATW
jgi:hypothetical protein